VNTVSTDVLNVQVLPTNVPFVPEKELTHQVVLAQKVIMMMKPKMLFVTFVIIDVLPVLLPLTIVPSVELIELIFQNVPVNLVCSN
jgi:hypothetical protein